MDTLVLYLLLFLVVGIGFILIHLLIGKLIRPARMDAEKATIYECGEPTIGSAWVQFDLRFYVVALLFVIFDVEVAFFFPWAVVFGKSTALAQKDLPPAERAALTKSLIPDYPENANAHDRIEKVFSDEADAESREQATQENIKAAHTLGWMALTD